MKPSPGTTGKDPVRLPFDELWLYSMTLAVVIAAAIVVTFLRTSNLLVSTVAGLVIATIGCIYLSRWWKRENCKRGIPGPMPVSRQWQFGVRFVLAIVGVIATEYVVFGSTANRYAEGAVALVLDVAIGFLLLPESYRRMRPVLASETSTWRVQYITQTAMFFIFIANCQIQLISTHHPQLDGMRNFVIAGYFAVIPLLPFGVWFGRRRYLEAKALRDADVGTGDKNGEAAS